MRSAAACLLTLAALLLFVGQTDTASADELLRIESSVDYAVDAADVAVDVTWQVSLENNDPATQPGGAQVFFYDGLSLPVLEGATGVSAESSEGVPLSVSLLANNSNVVDRHEVAFDRRLFFGDTYSFTLSYRLAESRSEAILITPAYVYVPLIALGDEASVTATVPDGGWETDLAEQDCPFDGNAFRCSGLPSAYVAGVLEASRPDMASTIQFEAPLAAGPVPVSLTYFQGDDDAANHQRDVIQASLPLIEEVYGFAPTLPSPEFVVEHGGRQSVFGYEGLTSCHALCAIVISPIASDLAVIHELAHLWSGYYDKRWISEGFAEWVAREAAARLPEGFLGDSRPFPATSRDMQLDEWDDAQSLIGADEESLAITEAGYDLSLRFIQTLADEVGPEGLRATNRLIAAAGNTVDSREFMDALEEATGFNPDHLFRLWIFSEADAPLIDQRREARDRYAEVEGQLTEGGFPDDPLAEIWQSIQDWEFDTALASLTQIEANLGRYVELASDLEALVADADTLGLTIPDTIGSAIERWEFSDAERLMESARSALGAYGVASERVAEPRSLWQNFGLIGYDPDSELAKAAEAFESAAFTRSQEYSESAVDMIDGAGGTATRRVLVATGILAAIAIAIILAYSIAVWRQQQYGEEG